MALPYKKGGYSKAELKEFNRFGGDTPTQEQAAARQRHNQRRSSSRKPVPKPDASSSRRRQGWRNHPVHGLNRPIPSRAQSSRSGARGNRRDTTGKGRQPSRITDAHRKWWKKRRDPNQRRAPKRYNPDPSGRRGGSRRGRSSRGIIAGRPDVVLSNRSQRGRRRQGPRTHQDAPGRYGNRGRGSVMGGSGGRNPRQRNQRRFRPSAGSRAGRTQRGWNKPIMGGRSSGRSGFIRGSENAGGRIPSGHGRRQYDKWKASRPNKRAARDAAVSARRKKAFAGLGKRGDLRLKADRDYYSGRARGQGRYRPTHNPRKYGPNI